MGRAVRLPGRTGVDCGPGRARSEAWLSRILGVFGDLCVEERRNKSRHASNEPEFVNEVIRLALAPGTSPRLAIETLTLLAGVEWPTASAILHFCHVAPYPILDFRALWSLSTDVPARYAYPFWREYSDFTRGLAERLGVNMRILDRALWKYSEVHQKSD